MRPRIVPLELLRQVGEDSWPWLVGGGVALTLLGLIGVGAATLATIVTVLAFGVVLFAAGVVQVLQGLRLPTWGGLSLYLVAGGLTLLAGLAMMWRPAAAAFPLTLVLAVYLVALGAFRAFVAATRPLPGRTWAVASGVASVVLGLIIGANWPISGAWAMGLLVSIDLLVTGAAQLLLGLEVRRIMSHHGYPGAAGA